MVMKMLILQPLDLCNLNCSYCYLPGRRNNTLMSDNVLNATFKSVFNSCLLESNNNDSPLRIIWHASEPLLAPRDFYLRAFDIINKFNINKIKCIHDFQTNATRLNDEWCQFIKQYQIQTAVSIDGPQFLHDKYRKNWAGKGSFQMAMRGVEYLRKHDIPLRAIAVITKDSLDYPEEIYSFFKENHFQSLCLNIEEQECHNESSTMDSTKSKPLIEKYYHFMSRLYDIWVADGKKMNIREFNRILSTMAYLKHNPQVNYIPSSQVLGFNTVTISRDGHVTTFSPELTSGTKNNPFAFVIGNVLKIDSFDELLNAQQFKRQMTAVNKGVERCAQECAYFHLCGGGSPSNKYYENGTFASTSTSFCTFTKKVLTDLVAEKLTGKPTNLMFNLTAKGAFE